MRKKKLVKGRLLRKRHFIFNLNKMEDAYLLFNRTYSNIFITLLDAKQKIIITKTSGISKVGNNKKKKKSPQAVEAIIRSMIKYFRLYKIKSLGIILRCKISIHMHTLVKELLYSGVKVASY